MSATLIIANPPVSAVNRATLSQTGFPASPAFVSRDLRTRRRHQAQIVKPSCPLAPHRCSHTSRCRKIGLTTTQLAPRLPIKGRDKLDNRRSTFGDYHDKFITHQSQGHDRNGGRCESVRPVNRRNQMAIASLATISCRNQGCTNDRPLGCW